MAVGDEVEVSFVCSGLLLFMTGLREKFNVVD